MSSASEPDNISNEIDSALEGINLQEFDLEPIAGAKGSSPKQKGSLQEGTIVGVDHQDVIVELGPRIQGVISVNEFDEPPKIGETFRFTMVGREDGLWLLSRSEALVMDALDNLHVGSLVKAKVTGQNTGGLELRVSGLAGFMPASHVSTERIEDLSGFIGQHLTVEVLELDPGRKRLLLSHRNVMKREQALAREETVRGMTPGMVVRGKVTRIESFGAFVNIGDGVEGLVHVSNLSLKRVDDPNDVLEVGQEVEAKVLDIKDGGQRIGLGIKQMQPDPWEHVATRLQPDTIVEAKVTRLMEFGAFMEIEPGLEGLLHISQMGTGNQQGGRRRGAGGLEIGQELSVRVQEVDSFARRISLSRLDSRGALLGSEEAADVGEIDAVLRDGQSRNLGTNLGNLFKKAMGGDEGAN